MNKFNNNKIIGSLKSFSLQMLEILKFGVKVLNTTFFCKFIFVTKCSHCNTFNDNKIIYCGPRISAQCVSHSMTSSIFKKTDLESPLIFILFLKGKQNKKENPKCDSLFWKRRSVKNRVGFEGQVTYREGTVWTIAPF